MFNITTSDGRLMLVHWVPLVDALYWLSYYRDKYKAGSPYPNNRGTYPDFGFYLIGRN